MSAETGTKVWVRHSKRAWTRGTLEEKHEKDGKFVFRIRKDPVEEGSDDGSGDEEEEEIVEIVHDVPEISHHTDVYLCNEFEDSRTLADVMDLTNLTHLHEPSILQALSDRFHKDEIYTNTGPILLAVNPFKTIKKYTQELLEMYYSTGLLKSQGLDAPHLPPHVYATGDAAYRSLVDSEDAGAKNQSILVSGESGAGKTESTKFIMQYLATVACDDEAKDGQKIADMVLKSNPILEAFGNARTNRNDNSSRFGKFIEMQFNKSGHLVGARIVTYLLEKVRLAKQGHGERNFHIFYQLCRGASEQQLEKWLVPDLENCGLTNQSDCYDRKDGVDDDDQFERMWKAMEVMGFPDEEKEHLMRAISAVMNLGNLDFESDDDEGCVISHESKETVDNCKTLIGVEQQVLQLALTTRKIKTVAETFTKKLRPTEAAHARDALAKTIYSKLFDYVVKRVNESIQVSAKVKTNFIGVLDIFGFEVFEQNSFEQLCINYANEQLQQQFNQFVFKLEQKEYEKEKIKWSFIDFPDNQACLDLIEAKPIGIIALLDDQCRVPNGNDKSLAGIFYDKLAVKERFTFSNKEKVNCQFTLQHYAGDVCYGTDGFVEKNKDKLYEEALELMRGCSDEFLSNLFKEGKGMKSKSGSDGGGKKGANNQSKTLGSQFKEQLADLLKTIKSTSPHYIRCLKPNDTASAGKIVRQRLVDQLRYGGVLEAVKVARAGYPVRMVLPEFVSRYFMLGNKMSVQKAKEDKEGRPATEKIVGNVQLEADTEYQIGRTKIFLRKGAYERIEDRRLSRMKQAATTIQAVARARQDVKRYAEMVKATRTLQRIIRGMLGRQRAQFARETKAATRIQTIIRQCLAIVYRKKCLRSVRTIQNAYRRHKIYEQQKEARKANAILSIQAWHRGLPARRSFLRYRTAAVLIQTSVRAKLARTMLKEEKRKAREVGTLQTKMEELKQRVRDLEIELEAVNSENETLKQQLIEASELTDKQEEQGEVSSEVVLLLKKELEDATRRNQELEEKLETMQLSSTAAVATTAGAYEASNAELQIQIEELQKELLEARDMLNETPQKPLGEAGESTDEQQQQQLVELRKQNEELKQQVESLKSQRNAGAVVGAAGAAAAIGVSAKDAAETATPVAPPPSNSPPPPPSDELLQAENEKLLMRVNQLEEELKQVQAAATVAASAAVAAGVSKENGGAAGLDKIAELERENEALIQQHATLVEKMCDAENRANEQQHEYQKLKAEFKDLKDERAAYEAMATQASGVKIALAKRLEVLILENRTLRQDKQEYENLAERLRQENSILKQQRK